MGGAVAFDTGGISFGLLLAAGLGTAGEYFKLPELLERTPDVTMETGGVAVDGRTLDFTTPVGLLPVPYGVGVDGFGRCTILFNNFSGCCRLVNVFARTIGRIVSIFLLLLACEGVLRSPGSSSSIGITVVTCESFLGRVGTINGSLVLVVKLLPVAFFFNSLKLKGARSALSFPF
uniref:Putative secreted protein n=1 Tax=Anopheles marajoara TaxID=58244 RepID=A0A2M4C5U2_9DIPT